MWQTFMLNRIFNEEILHSNISNFGSKNIQEFFTSQEIFFMVLHNHKEHIRCVIDAFYMKFSRMNW